MYAACLKNKHSMVLCSTYLLTGSLACCLGVAAAVPPPVALWKKSLILDTSWSAGLKRAPVEAAGADVAEEVDVAVDAGGEAGRAGSGSWWNDLILVSATERPSLSTVRISEVLP